MVNVVVLAPQTSASPSPDLGASAPGGPRGQPASQPTPANTSQPSSQPARCHPVCQHLTPELLQVSKITFQPSKTPENQRFSMVFAMSALSLQHPFWMPEAPKFTPSDSQRASRSRQVHPKCSLEAPKVVPNTPIYSHGGKSEPNLSPGAPKIHPKTQSRAPPSSQIPLQPSKTIKNQWFSMVFAMSAWLPTASILDARGTQSGTK